jgi:hypothetical protein
VRRRLLFAAALVPSLLAAAESTASTAGLTTVRLDQHSSYIAPAIGGHLVLGANVATVTRALGRPARRQSSKTATTLYYGPLGGGRSTWRITFRPVPGCAGRRAWSLRSESPRLDLDSGRALVRPHFGRQDIYAAIRSDLDRYDSVGWFFGGWNKAKTVAWFGGSDSKEKQLIFFGLDARRKHFLEIRLDAPGDTNFPPQLHCRS